MINVQSLFVKKSNIKKQNFDLTLYNFDNNLVVRVSFTKKIGNLFASAWHEFQIFQNNGNCTGTRNKMNYYKQTNRIEEREWPPAVSITERWKNWNFTGVQENYF